jgi:riboflavin biosynthesis pyrimidine reductase
MRQIFPAPGRDLGKDEDELASELRQIYAYPEGGTCVRANMIASVDGAIAVAGRSGALSGPGDRLLFHVLRSLADVIVVGAGTARAEHYGPASRSKWVSAGRVPPIAVVTKWLSLAADSPLIRDSVPRTIVLTTEQAPAQAVHEVSKTADVVVVGAESVPTNAIVSELTGRGYRKLLLEGGPSLLGEFAAADLLQELCVTTSPLLEGGYTSARMVLASTEAATTRAASTGAATAPAAGPGAPRGREQPDPTPLELRSVLEDGGFLFTRYARQ